MRWRGLGMITVALYGCASMGPSPALLDARRMQKKADADQVNRLAPAQLREAEQLLARAEDAHRSHPQSIEEKHLSHLAIDEFEIAIAEGRRRDARQREEDARRRYFNEQAQLRQRVDEQTAQLKKNHQEVVGRIDANRAELAALEKRIESGENMDAAQIEELRTAARTLTERLQILAAKREALEAALAEHDHG